MLDTPEIHYLVVINKLCLFLRKIFTMNQINKIEFLNRIELFYGLSQEEILLVADHFENRTYDSGEIIFKEKDPREKIYMIINGHVELSISHEESKSKRLSVFGKYDFLGEGSLTDDSYHSTNARAMDTVELFMLNKDFFKDKGNITLKVFSNVFKIINRRLQNMNSVKIGSAAQYQSTKTRTEHDLLGYRDVPDEYLYGIQTLRALENFNISNAQLNFYPLFIEALAEVKMAAAKANHKLGLLDDDLAGAIIQACTEIINGRFHNHFVVDMIQGGAGTSTNMNANEVIANRALEIMGRKRGQYEYCHPNNHINLSQSTNDAYPTSIKLALLKSNIRITEVLKELISAFHAKAKEFSHVIKMGRTQLQDAVPMTLGQEFEAYAVMLTEEIERLNHNVRLFLEINMGGTAIGTGINAEPGYSDLVMKYMSEVTGFPFVLASNLVEATQDTGAFIMYSSALKRLAVKLSKISNDLRLLSSGPRAGFNEINLPPMQPGSTIMPGKVNPVIPEAMNQIAFKVIGNDLAITMAAEAGQLELNVMEPLIVQSLFENIDFLINGINIFNHKCIIGITANEEVCRNMVYNSIGLVTALNPYIGYEASTKIAKEALETGKSVYELVLNNGLMTKDKLDEILNPENMIGK